MPKASRHTHLCTEGGHGPQRLVQVQRTAVPKNGQCVIGRTEVAPALQAAFMCRGGLCPSMSPDAPMLQPPPLDEAGAIAMQMLHSEH